MNKEGSSSSSCSQEVGDLCSSEDISIGSEMVYDEPHTFTQEDDPLEPSQYESTADFNKELKEVRSELIEEG
jgi:hypothetical protein